MKELSSPGCLQPDNLLLPHTIRDAIRVTEGIGEQYIWVDALCIIQDDEVDKAEQIKSMAAIYPF